MRNRFSYMILFWLLALTLAAFTLYYGVNYK
jgi:hypothetical protein